jgi:two-component system response regulator YesN
MVKDAHTHTKIDSASVVRNVIAYINLHYDSIIANESIAEVFNYNSTYLNRIFKLYTGSSLHAFLLSRSITAAMEMLCSQSLSVGEVAEKCGFGSLHHFTKSFKKRTGMTPSQYRNR